MRTRTANKQARLPRSRVPAGHILLARLSARFDALPERWYGFSLVLPSFLFLMAMSFLPTLAVVALSFTEFDYGSFRFVGGENYARIFTEPAMYRYFGHSLKYVAISIITSFVVGLAMALALNFKGLKLRGLYRTVSLWAWGIPPVVASLTWKWMYNDVSGVLNDILLRWRLIKAPIAWLAHPNLAMWSAAIVHAWTTIPFFIILLLAGLQAIPDELHEVAAIDGATAVQRFWHITIPFLKPAIMVAVMTNTIFAFRTIDFVYTLTKGGPGDATEMLVTQIYVNAFQFLKLGYASALSVVLMIITVLFVLLCIRLFRSDVGA